MKYAANSGKAPMYAGFSWNRLMTFFTKIQTDGETSAMQELLAAKQRQYQIQKSKYDGP